MNAHELDVSSQVGAWLAPATVTGLPDTQYLTVRYRRGSEQTVEGHARLARLVAYRPRVGDRVLCAGDDDGQLYAIAVLHAAEAPAIEVDEDHNLRLRAPAGAVMIDAATDIEVSARRDIKQHASRNVTLDTATGKQRIALSPSKVAVTASTLQVAAKRSHLAGNAITVVARSIATTAQRVALQVEEHEVTANSIVQKAHDKVVEIRGLAESRFGRLRMHVKRSFDVAAQRTGIRSERETVIDGERILLG